LFDIKDYDAEIERFYKNLEFRIGRLEGIIGVDLMESMCALLEKQHKDLIILIIFQILRRILM
jgi:hypothetical protein